MDDDDDDFWLESYPRQWRAALCLAWKRPPAPRWNRWRSMLLRASTAKRRATWAQPHPRWRHADGRAADEQAFRQRYAALTRRAAAGQR